MKTVSSTLVCTFLHKKQTNKDTLYRPIMKRQKKKRKERDTEKTPLEENSTCLY